MEGVIGYVLEGVGEVKLGLEGEVVWWNVLQLCESRTDSVGGC
jgi:hypothetical protein